MKKIMEQMAEELSAAFEKAGYDPSYGKVTVSNRPDLCEYQCNGAMAGAKAYHKAPFMIADDVVAQLSDSRIFSRAEVVKPGFINLDVKTEFVAEYMNKMAEDEKLSVETAKNPKTIIIDYGGPNVAKPLHVGHLRSAIIGESIKRIGRFVGHKVIGDVHLGDWGLQRHRLLSASWKRSIHVPVGSPKRMRLTVMRHWRQPTFFSRVNPDTWRSGTTS